MSQKNTNKQRVPPIPAPFKPVSPGLQVLLQQCDTAKVYLLHIDTHKADYKRNIFLIPVILNGTIGLLLLWRIYAAAPTYWALLLSIFGFQSSANIDTTTTTRRQQFLLMLRRAALILVDYLLFRFVGPWPLTFFAEQPANPVTWRWKLGFQAQEVVARVSRGWGAEDLLGGTKKGSESAFYKTRIAPAIGAEAMSKTGYLLMDRSWDLDFQLMVDAHTLIRDDKMKITDIDGVVLAHVEGETGWCEYRWQTPSSSDEELKKAVARLKAEASMK